jgi:hypothetical protein
VPVVESDEHGEAPYYSLTHQTMPNKKVFRVLITDTLGFYLDTEADNADEATQIIRRRLDDPKDDVQPIEDDTCYTGYQVESASEIDRKDADLDV